MTRLGRLYTPRRTVTAEARLAYAGQAAMAGRPPLDGAVEARRRDRGRHPDVLVEAPQGRGAQRTRSDQPADPTSTTF